MLDHRYLLKAIRKGPSLICEVIAVAGHRDTIPIHLPVRCSKANDKMERAIRTYQGQFRTLKHFSETGIKRQLMSSCAMCSWLVAWTADVLNSFKVHDGGRTAYERITRPWCNHMAIGFWETAVWQMTPDKTARDGIVLGVIWRSECVQVANSAPAQGLGGVRGVLLSLYIMPN